MPKTQALKMNKQHIIISTTSMIAAFLIMLTTAFAGEPQSWQNQEFKVKGEWSIEKRDDGHYVVLSEDFKTRSAPDLKLFVSKEGHDSITGENATTGSALVAKLSSNKGAQSYKIPSDINLDEYSSLIIHCEQYSKLWASTPLK